MFKNWQGLAVSLSIGMIIGSTITGIRSGNRQQWALMGSGAGIAGLVCAGGFLLINPSAKKDEELRATGMKLAQSEADFKRLESDHCTLKQTSAKFEQMSTQYYQSAEKLQEEIKAILSRSGLEHSKWGEQVNSLSAEIERLKAQILSQSEQHQKALATEQKTIDELEAEIQSLKDNQTTFIENEATKRIAQFKRQELEQIYNDFAPVTDEAIQISEEFESIVHSLWDKNQQAQQVAEKFKGDQQNLTALYEAFQEEKQTWIGEMEAMRVKIAELQQTERGIFHQPIVNVNALDEANMIATQIVGRAFDVCKVPLKVECWTPLHDGKCSFGLLISANQNLDSAISVLNANSETIGKFTGSFEPPKFKRSDVFNGIVCSVQYRKRTLKADMSQLLKSPEQFLKVMRSERPFIRLIAAPQGGKTPVIGLIVAEILRHGFQADTGESIELVTVSYCDPLEGMSVKNTGSLKFVDHSDTYDAAFEKLETELTKRSSKQNKNRDSAYLWICDEFDVAIQEDNKRNELIRKISKQGTHANIGVITASQTDQIAQLKMNTSDLKMWRNVLLDEASIRGFLTNYGEKMLGERKVKELLETYEKIMSEHDGINDHVSDVGRRFRVALVVDKYPAFYQLPYFDTADFDVKKYRQNQESIASNQTDLEVSQEEAKANSFDVLKCPDCGSTNLKAYKGDTKTRQGVVTKYRECKGCSSKFKVKDTLS